MNITKQELKVQKRYKEAGALAYREGGTSIYGCHFGLREDYEKAAREFKEGWLEEQRLNEE
jgi:hypothetical protein